MKKVIALLMALAMALTLSASAASACEVCEGREHILHDLIEPQIELVTMDQWVDEGIFEEDRDGRLIIVRVIGEVVNGETGEGVAEGSYIAYEPGRYQKGDQVVTWLLANPENTYIDDFIARWDELVREGEKS